MAAQNRSDIAATTTTLSRDEANHIATSAALEAWTIAERLNSDRAQDLLDNIGALNEWADLAAWATAGGGERLSDRGLVALHKIRAIDHDDLNHHLAASDTHDEDLAFYRQRVAWVDRVIATVEKTARA